LAEGIAQSCYFKEFHLRFLPKFDDFTIFLKLTVGAEHLMLFVVLSL